MRALLTYLLQDLYYHRGRTGLILTGLAVTVFSYLVLVALASAMDTFGSLTEGHHNLVVTEAGLVDPREGRITPAVLEAAREVPAGAVNRVSPLVVRTIRVGEPILTLFSADPADWPAVYELTLVEGRWVQGPGEVVVGEGVSIVTGQPVGASLRIFGRDFSIAGVVRAPAAMYGSIWMDLVESEQLFGPDQAFQFVFLQLASEADAETVRAGLEADVRLAGRYAVYHQDQLNRRFAEGLQDVRLLTRVVAVIALVSIGLGCYSAAVLSLAERQREVAALRAIGYRPSAIRRMMMAWAGLQAVVAYLAGAAAALLFIAWQQRESPLLIVGVSLPLELSLAEAASGLALTLLLALAGAALAATFATVGSVADLLRP
jgi:hypothetical protein